ncbi:MAG: GFA family protein [Paracoccus sp. (in: a-proteobacteria)]|uniref:GFA family protein n=1 Tax=Paracoccus sp. TaxID=267 RepID=UPI0026DFE4CE|nr:GFA family protein [Paracoccus sp. (in: a-proteobacteria)]MDO5613191.1 GFA family protein [Paracoccus sp. (in: a-proteobacteria)]
MMGLILQQGEVPGRCLCGACRFAARPEGAAHICHCSMCRQWTGGMFISVGLSQAPRFDDAAPLGVFRSSDWGERVFCKDCGASLIWRTQDGAMNMASVQCFDDPGRFALETEIFIDEKPASYALAGQHQTMTGAEVMAMFAPKDEG